MKSSVLSNIFFILNTIRKYCFSYIVFTVLFSLLSIVSPVIDTLVPKLIVDFLISHNSVEWIYRIIFMVFVFNCINAIAIPLFFDYIIPKYENIIKSKMSKELMKKSSSLDLEFFENPDFYNKYTMALKQAEERFCQFMYSFGGLLGSFFYIFSLFTIIVILDPFLIIISLGSVGLSLVFNNKVNKTKYKYDVLFTPITRVDSYIKRVFYEPQYCKEIRFFNIFNLLSKKYNDNIKNKEEFIKRRAKKVVSIQSFVNIIQQPILFAIIMIYLVNKIINKTLTPGDFTALFLATIQLSSQLSAFMMKVSEFYQHSLYVNSLKEILNIEPKIEKANLESSITLNTKKSNISLDNISFKYKNSNDYTLKNISININSGEKIAIVGRNGACKSTRATSSIRLYDPNKGNIYLNNTNYKEYNINHIRDNIGLVFQDFQLYAISIAENILLRKIESKEDEEIINNALKKSGIYEKVQGLPKGIYTCLTSEFDKDGVSLSGGEIQKIALARIYAQENNIIILDEPSSALDPISEHEIHNQILQNTQDKTVILISHRLSTTRDVDKIYLIDKGSVLEEGTHNELMNLNGEYAKMFTVQSSKYLET